MMPSVLTLDPSTYPRHAIHAGERIWAETNCYTDIWIELLHAWGHDPVASLAFTLAMDFEGDQWTFFKPPLGDLYTLYGLDVRELAIAGPLTRHIEEQIGQGHPVLVELDSYFLPDTAGTAYRREHVKSTVAVNSIGSAERTLGYFHNQGYYHLGAEDFAGCFRLDVAPDPTHLPPYVEFVKPRRPPGLPADTLLDQTFHLLRHHLGRVPETNPFERFRTRFEADLSWLVGDVSKASQGKLEAFHAYSFATFRQFGACCELAATYLRWLQERTGKGLDGPIEDFLRIATSAKTIQFQLARAIARMKPLDLSPLETMGQAWRSAINTLKATFP
jgi:hypothetical protein